MDWIDFDRRGAIVSLNINLFKCFSFNSRLWKSQAGHALTSKALGWGTRPQMRQTPGDPKRVDMATTPYQLEVNRTGRTREEYHTAPAPTKVGWVLWVAPLAASEVGTVPHSSRASEVFLGPRTGKFGAMAGEGTRSIRSSNNNRNNGGRGNTWGMKGTMGTGNLLIPFIIPVSTTDEEGPVN